MTRRSPLTLLALLALLTLLFALPAAAETPSRDAIVETVAATLLDGFGRFETVIDVSTEGLDEDNFYRIGRDALNTVLDRYPEYDSSILQSCRSVTDKAGRQTMLIEYKENARDLRVALEAKLAEIFRGLNPYWNEYQTLLHCHDWVVVNFSYDLTYTKDSVYDTLEDGTAGCEAYARFMRILLNRLGFKNEYAKSHNHMWNVVLLSDGNWYHLDTTWDDPIPDRVGRAEHEYFLVSDKERLYTAKGEYYPFTSPVKCTSTRLDNRGWHRSASPFVEVNGTWYTIIHQTRTLATYDFETDKLTSLNVKMPAWKTHNNPAHTYLSAYSGLIAREGILYYNTPTGICGYNTVTGERMTYFAPNTAEGYLVGIAEIDGQLHFGLRNDPFEYEYVCYDFMPMPAYTALAFCRNAPFTLHREADQTTCEGVKSGTKVSELRAAVLGGTVKITTRTGLVLGENATLRRGDIIALIAADGSVLDRASIVIAD